VNSCELCATPGGEILWQSPECRVVRVDDPDYPGFCRVIWQAHVREMTDLSAVDRVYLMEIVWAVEALVRELYAPDKINLASFGNMTPHVHWHVIPRWLDDRHFPQPVWGAVQRTPQASRPQIAASCLAEKLAAVLDPITISRSRHE
jgi:diadenosine tetraphosphate (Ap4A) HIT family hydrolase